MNLTDLRQRIRNAHDATPQGGRWYEIHNAEGTDGPAVIRLYGTIGGWFGEITADDFVAELDDITADEIVCQINSTGGDVWDGIAIYNALRQHPAHVTTRVDAMAASAASFIAQAGDHRVMVKSSQMMIHKAWSLMIGNADEMREWADVLDQQDDIIAGIYADRSEDPDKGKDHYMALMAKESWFTDSGAVDEGLADEVVDPPRKTKDAITTITFAGDALNDAITVSGNRLVATTGTDNPPLDGTDHPNRFSDLLASAMAGWKQVAKEARSVMTFRTAQGKPALSDDAVALLVEGHTAIGELLDAAQPSGDTGAEQRRRQLELAARRHPSHN